MEGKDKEKDVSASNVAECSDEMEVKDKEKDVSASNVAECSDEMEGKDKEKDVSASNVAECSDETEVKDKETDVSASDVVECSHEMEGKDKEKDVSTSDVAECSHEMVVKDKGPSISTMCLNHQNKLDAYYVSRTSAGDVGESSHEMEVMDREPSISRMLLNHENMFDPYHASSTPLYLTATFKQPSAKGDGRYVYTRSGNPTRDALESLLAKLDKANRAFCFTSGMAALAVVTHLVGTGEHIVAGNDMYGGSDRLLSQVIRNTGIVVDRVNTTDLDAVAPVIHSHTKLVWLESPTNPLQQISDIRKIADMAHDHGAIVLVDNSIMSPVLSQPLELGADIVMHSATKFIAGHSDVMAGVLAVKEERLARSLYLRQNAEGSGLAPFDCWICLRGIKTMALRVEKQQENAQKIAEFLSCHPKVTKVYYAGLPDHPGRSLHYSQAKGAGSVLSFLTGSPELSRHIVETTKYFSITVSFGSVDSLISIPCFMSHAGIPAREREKRGLTADLVRISVGIEDVNDLIADLDDALRTGPM